MSTEGPSPARGRPDLIELALRLSYASVIWSVINGVAATVAGAGTHSLGVLGLGLNIFGDLIGSLGLIWRFRVERVHAHHGQRAESRISLVVAAALMVVGVSLSIAAVHNLVQHTVPGSSALSTISSFAAIVVLVPLGVAKRRVGSSMRSRALMGDGTLSIIGASLGAAALVGLATNSWWHWWWADRVVALIMAGVAVMESTNVIRHRGASRHTATE